MRSQIYERIAGMSVRHDIRRAVVRQAPLLALLGIALAAAITAFCVTQRDLYQSSVTAVYDSRDALGLPANSSGDATRFEQIASTLKARLAEPEFLWQVARAVELSLDPSTEAPLSDDSSTKAKVAALLGPLVRSTSDTAGQAFTIRVLAEDALTAKRLADAAMEIFIQKELRFEAETIHRLYEAHAKFLEEAQKAAPPEGDAQFVSRLEERVRELDLERRRLTSQIDRPAERTRFRLTVPATYDDIPAKHTRRRAAIMLGLSAVLFLFGVGAARELGTSLARSRRRVEHATRLPVLAELPRRALKSLAEADYQAIDRALGRVLVGPVILLAVPGTRGGTKEFVHQFLCHSGLDQTATRLVIDGERRDPLGTVEERRRPKGDLGQFLASKIPWKEVRLTRTAERPYDLVYAAPAEDDGKSPYVDGLLAKLFTSLCRGYGRVYVRAHELRHEAEVGALAKAATDCVLIVDARTTKLDALLAARDLLGEAKVRGVILLGT